MSANGPVVQVVRTGIANLASVLAGFRRLGAQPEVTQDPEAVRAATHVMLPGVGAFGAAMQTMRDLGLDSAIRERIEENRPTMAICVGLQVLAHTSEESPGVAGIGVFDTDVIKLPPEVRVPQLGWNEVRAPERAQYLRNGFAYFANSYHLREAPSGWIAAYSDHGREFLAGVERGRCLALQFHPELSGEFGEGILRRWLAQEDAS